MSSWKVMELDSQRWNRSGIWLLFSGLSPESFNLLGVTVTAVCQWIWTLWVSGAEVDGGPFLDCLRSHLPNLWEVTAVSLQTHTLRVKEEIREPQQSVQCIQLCERHQSELKLRISFWKMTRFLSRGDLRGNVIEAHYWMCLLGWKGASHKLRTTF